MNILKGFRFFIYYYKRGGRGKNGYKNKFDLILLVVFK